MKFQYYKHTTILMTALAFATAACGQSKVKTITIINGDTTISESNEINDKEFKQIEKEISVIHEGDSKSENKTIVKKIIINGDDAKNGDIMAYAYSTDGENDAEVITSDDGKETKIIIRKDKDAKNTPGGKKKIATRSVDSDNTESKEKMSLNISVKDKTANLEIETSSKESLFISVLDASGKQIFYDSKKDGGKYNKDLKLEKGTYFLSIIQNKKTTNDKIVIE